MKEKPNLLRALQEESWDSVQNTQDLNDMYDNFLEVFMRHYNACIPRSPILLKKKKSAPVPPWLYSIKETLDLIRETSLMHPEDDELKDIFRSYKDFYLQQCDKHSKMTDLIDINQADNKTKAIWRKISDLTGRGRNNDKSLTLSREIFNEYFTTSID